MDGDGDWTSQNIPNAKNSVFKITAGMVNCVHITPERKCHSKWRVNLQCMFKGKEYIINDKVLSIFFQFFYD